MTRMTSNRDSPRFSWMSVLSVAAFCLNQIPTVSLYHPYDISYIH